MNKQSPHYLEWKEKMRLHNVKLGNNRKGKTLEEIHGAEKAKRIREKLRMPHKNTDELRERCHKVNEFRRNKTYEEIYGPERAKEIKERMGGRTPWNKGKKGCFSKDAINKMIVSRIGKKFPKDTYPNHGMRGKTFSEESKHKLSMATKGKNHPMYGKKHTEESKRKMSETTRGMPIWNKGKHYTKEQYDKIFNEDRLRKLSERMILDKHFNWQGGKSFEPYGLDFNNKFKETIRERDNRCCIICNKLEEELGYRLPIHHIDYDKKNNFPQNCVSLCRNHHTDTNYNRQHWKSFFQSLLKERYGYKYTQDQKIILDFTNNEMIE